MKYFGLPGEMVITEATLTKSSETISNVNDIHSTKVLKAKTVIIIIIIIIIIIKIIVMGVGGLGLAVPVNLVLKNVTNLNLDLYTSSHFFFK